MNEDRIPDDEWETIVSNVPIVSVDLVVKHNDGVVLGRRQNEPAKGEWFVPGGRVKKHERLQEAVHRVAQEELGIEVEIIDELGSYEHLYETSEMSYNMGKHYLANGFVVETCQNEFDLDNQHNDMRIFNRETLPSNLHRYVNDYLKDAAIR